MMKDSYVDIWSEEGEVTNFTLMMRKAPYGDGGPSRVQEDVLGFKTKHLLFTTFGTSIVPSSKPRASSSPCSKGTILFPFVPSMVDCANINPLAMRNVRCLVFPIVLQDSDSRTNPFQGRDDDTGQKGILALEDMMKSKT